MTTSRKVLRHSPLDERFRLMARRLPVVVAQSPISSPQRRDLEEALVGALLMERGIDLNVVAHLEDLEQGETGLLCLEGISGAMVVASWLAPEKAHSLLSELGITGRRGRSKFDSHGTTGGEHQRTIYHFDLGRAAAVPALIAEFQRIRDDLSTPTISLNLSGLGTSSPAPSKPPVEPAVLAPHDAPIAPDASPTDRAKDDDDDNDEQLDRLIDRLDELDL